jgi:hypothetical protein
MVRKRPLISEFNSAESFHKSRKGYFDAFPLYSPMDSKDGFSPVFAHKGKHMLSAPVTIGRVTLRVPFIVDTGAEHSLLHAHAWARFAAANKKLCGRLVVEPVLVGTHAIFLDRNAYTTIETGGVHHIGFLNILGLNFLDEAVPDLKSYISEAITKFQPPLSTVTVTDGKGVVFPVVPEQPQVMFLKKAIKPSWEPIERATIIIKHPATGKVLGDKEALHSGVEYVYELP